MVDTLVLVEVMGVGEDRPGVVGKFVRKSTFALTEELDHHE